MEIRQEKFTDYEEVFEINENAFSRDNEARLVDLLRTSKAFIPELSIVAIDDDILIGHILFTKVTITLGDGKAHESLALAPMAVVNNYQGKGVGAELIRYGLDRAKELGFKSVIVLGHANYYPKFGFKPAAQWNIKAPFEVPSEAFMAIELIAKSLEGVSGIVQYPKEFDMV